MKDVGGAGFAGSSPPFLGREQVAVDVDVGPELPREFFFSNVHCPVSPDLTAKSCVLLKRKKQKARPKGVNLKVRWRAKVAMRYCSE